MKEEKSDKMKKEKKENQKRNSIVIITILAVIILFAVSYAIFTYTGKGKERNTLTTGTLRLTLEEDSNLTLANQTPIRDIDAMSVEAYTFTINNTGTETAKYQIILVQDEEKYSPTDKKLPWSSIRFSIIKNNGINIIKNLQDQDGVLTTTTVEAGKTDQYALRLWIDEQADEEISGATLHAKIKIKAILENRNNFETGAPE